MTADLPANSSLVETHPELLGKLWNWQVMSEPLPRVLTSFGNPSTLIMQEELAPFPCDDGQLVACDPHFLRSVKPLAETVPPCWFDLVTYEVEVLDGRRVALAWVHLYENPSSSHLSDVVAWRSAGSPTRVDYAMAAYCAGETAAILAGSAQAFEDMHTWLEAPVRPRYMVDPPSYNYVVGFQSGMGDGSYPMHWGLDHDGHIIGLLTDFLLVSGPADPDQP